MSTDLDHAEAVLDGLAGVFKEGQHVWWKGRAGHVSFLPNRHNRRYARNKHEYDCFFAWQSATSGEIIVCAYFSELKPRLDDGR